VEKFKIGEPCTQGLYGDKPENIYCKTDRRPAKTGSFLNLSGKLIPEATFVSLILKNEQESIKATEIKSDKKIVGIAREDIPAGAKGWIYLGDGDPECRYICSEPPYVYGDESIGDNEILYVAENGKITNIKPKNAVTVGRSKAGTYGFYMGNLEMREISTWKRYESKGAGCTFLNDDDIAPDLRCNEDSVLSSAVPDKPFRDTFYDLFGFFPDAPYIAMIILILLITILGFVLSEGSLGVRLFKTITGTVMLLSVAALIVTIYISVVEPLFSSNSVDFSKKVFGVPFYFFLFLTMFSAIVRGKRK
jgi:hypothetical protein